MLHVHRLRVSDRISFVTVNLRRAIAPLSNFEYLRVAEPCTTWFRTEPCTAWCRAEAIEKPRQRLRSLFWGNVLDGITELRNSGKVSHLSNGGSGIPSSGMCAGEEPTVHCLNRGRFVGLVIRGDCESAVRPKHPPIPQMKYLPGAGSPPAGVLKHRRDEDWECGVSARLSS